MMKQKGIILKIKKDLAVIMTSDCRIISIRVQPGMDVGMEISFNKNEIVHKKNKLVLPLRITAGVAAVFVIIFMIFNSPFRNGVYAYVTIDADASIEFEVDKDNKIIKVNTFDADTNELLKDMDLRHQPIDVAIKEVIEKTSTKDSTILISACLKENKKIKSNDTVQNKEFSQLIDVCKSVVEDDVYGDIQSKVVEVPYTYKKLADSNKISIGRSIVYEKAKEQGIDIEEIKKESIGEALKKVSIDDVAIVHDVKKPKKIADEPIPKVEPIDKTAQTEKKDPKPIEEPKDKVKEAVEAKEKQEPEIKPDTAAKTKPEIKIDPEKKTDTAVKKVTEPKPETGTKLEPESKTEPKAEIKPEIEQKNQVDTKPVPKSEPAPKAEDEQKSESEAKNVPKAEAKPDPEIKPGPEPKFEADKKLESDIKPEPKSEPEIKPEPEPKPETDPKPDAKLESKPEPKPEPDPKPESDIKPDPKPEL